MLHSRLFSYVVFIKKGAQRNSFCNRSTLMASPRIIRFDGTTPSVKTAHAIDYVRTLPPHSRIYVASDEPADKRAYRAAFGAYHKLVAGTVVRESGQLIAVDASPDQNTISYDMIVNDGRQPLVWIIEQTMADDRVLAHIVAETVPKLAKLNITLILVSHSRNDWPHVKADITYSLR